MFLSRITFYSRNAIKVGESAGVIRGILHACSEYSPSSGLTGGLVFNERFYLQVMEGAREQIARQMASIMADERHAGVTLIGMHEIERRDFDGWAVGYAGRTIDAERLFLRYGTVMELDPTRMTGASAEAFVREFTALDTIYVQRATPFEARQEPPQQAAAPPLAGGGVERIRVTHSLQMRTNVS